MRIDRSRAIFLALAALYAVAARSRRAPVQASIELRAVLAALAAMSDGDRTPFDSFWRAVTGKDDSRAGPMVAIERGNRAMIAWNQIARAMGAPGDPEFMTLVSVASRKGPDRP